MNCPFDSLHFRMREAPSDPAQAASIDGNDLIDKNVSLLPADLYLRSEETTQRTRGRWRDDNRRPILV